MQTGFREYPAVGLVREHGEAPPAAGGWERVYIAPGPQKQQNGQSCGIYAAMSFCRLCAGHAADRLDLRFADVEPYYRAFVAAIQNEATLTPATFPDETGFGALLKSLQ